MSTPPSPGHPPASGRPPPYDVVAVGAGPGGYVAAIRSAQLGLRTALVERDQLGGVCLNRGCIPSKAMLRSAEIADLVRQAAAFGIEAADPRVVYETVLTRRDAAVARLRQGVTVLLRRNGVDVIPGTARLENATTLQVRSGPGHQAIDFRNLIVATGSRSKPPPIPGADLPGVIDSDAALSLPQPPGQVVVVGGGAVGVEWAEIWRALGSDVTVVEMLPQLLPNYEPELVRELTRFWSRKGIAHRVGAKIGSIQARAGKLEVSLTVGSGEERLGADVVLTATGRWPNVEELNLEAAGVWFGPAGIPTDDHMRTNVPHIFAVGDVTGGHLLAHVASHQGIIAAEAIAGAGEAFDERVVPSVVFTEPEIASVGIGERAAIEQGVQVQVGRFPFAASGRAAASGETDGLVKIIAAQASGQILGAHIVGPRAGDLVSEIALAMRLRATLRDLAHTIHPHPTFSEALMEAAWAAMGTPIHIPPRPTRLRASPTQ